VRPISGDPLREAFGLGRRDRLLASRLLEWRFEPVFGGTIKPMIDSLGSTAAASLITLESSPFVNFIRSQHDVRNNTAAISSLELDHNVHHGQNKLFYISVRQTHVRLERHHRELNDGATWAVCMDSRQRPWMPRVDRAEKGERLWSSQFAKYNPVRTHPECGAQEVVSRDLGFTLAAPRCY